MKTEEKIQPIPSTVHVQQQQQQQQQRAFSQPPIQNVLPNASLETSLKLTPTNEKPSVVDDRIESMDLGEQENFTIGTVSQAENHTEDTKNSALKKNGDVNQMMQKVDMQDIVSESEPEDMEI